MIDGNNMGPEQFDVGINPEFQEYKTSKYLEKVYPEDFDLAKLKPAIDEVLEKSKDRKIDVEEIRRKYGIERIVDVENICLLAFNTRVAKYLLKEYPNGSASSIEIDGGGVFIGHGTSSLVASQITHFEYLEQGKKESQQWLNPSEKPAHNWDQYLRFIQENLKGNEEVKLLLISRLKSDDENVRRHAEMIRDVLDGDVEAYKKWIRGRVKPEIQKGDIFKENFGQTDNVSYDVADVSNRQNAYDFVTTNFTSESATSKRFSWLRGMLNVMNAVKPGGHLVLTACLETNYYMVGEQKILATPVTGEEIRTTLERKGFEVIEHQEIYQEEDSSLGYQKLGFFLAKKIDNKNSIS